jgi:AcrR family transcriptional regulator
VNNFMSPERLYALPPIGGMDDSPRGRVLRAAAYLFHEQGYARTTVRELALMVGIQSGSLFHHFKSKDAILCAVMEEAIIYNLQQMQNAVDQGTTPTERLKGLIRAELEAINGKTSHAMSVLVYEWNAITKQQQEPLLEMRQEYEGLWLKVLDDLKSEGKVDHDTFICRRLISGATFGTALWYKPNGRISIPELAEATLAMALRG